MHNKIDFCINSGQNGYFVLRLKKYLRNTKSSSVESFILALLWFNSQPEIENILSQATLVEEIVNNAWYRYMFEACAFFASLQIPCKFS